MPESVVLHDALDLSVICICDVSLSNMPFPTAWAVGFSLSYNCRISGHGL